MSSRPILLLLVFSAGTISSVACELVPVRLQKANSKHSRVGIRLSFQFNTQILPRLTSRCFSRFVPNMCAWATALLHQQRMFWQHVCGKWCLLEPHQLFELKQTGCRSKHWLFNQTVWNLDRNVKWFWLPST